GWAHVDPEQRRGLRCRGDGLRALGRVRHAGYIGALALAVDGSDGAARQDGKAREQERNAGFHRITSLCMVVGLESEDHSSFSLAAEAGRRWKRAAQRRRSTLAEAPSPDGRDLCPAAGEASYLWLCRSRRPFVTGPDHKIDT